MLGSDINDNEIVRFEMYGIDTVSVSPCRCNKDYLAKYDYDCDNDNEYNLFRH